MKIELGTIAIVRNSEINVVKGKAGAVTSTILLADPLTPESLQWISEFSRLYVVYLRGATINNGTMISQSTEVGNIHSMPGVPSVREDINPNEICIASVELIAFTERSLKAKFQYAIDGAFVLAMIPVPAEGVVTRKKGQSDWLGGTMKNFWKF